MNKKWAEDVISIKERKLQSVKKTWIEEMKLHNGSHIDEDFGSLLSRHAGEQESQFHSSNAQKQTKQKVVKENKRFSDKEWEIIFEQMLAEDKIDVSNDFYDEEILFDSPDQLIEIFSLLEEQNLKKIRAC